MMSCLKKTLSDQIILFSHVCSKKLTHIKWDGKNMYMLKFNSEKGMYYKNSDLTYLQSSKLQRKFESEKIINCKAFRFRAVHK